MGKKGFNMKVGVGPVGACPRARRLRGANPRRAGNSAWVGLAIRCLLQTKRHSTVVSTWRWTGPAMPAIECYLTAAKSGGRYRRGCGGICLESWECGTVGRPTVRP